MEFLTPATIAITAAATIPPLVALYFLKLKRTIRVVPSTLLWKRAVEDLQVNSPFQRLRKSLLLLLQLLVLALAALALGKPMLEYIESHDDNVIILIDQSASMDVLEKDGRTRLDQAKEQAKAAIENMKDGGRAMVISFCDRAAVASPFETSKAALKSRIDAIEPTQSNTRLGEAVSLAEAYLQNIIIGGETEGTDIAPESAAPPATVYLYTDGNVADLDKVSPQHLDIDKVKVFAVGERHDNVAILAMDARRHYERPQMLQVFATVRNFGDEPAQFDAVLYIDDRNIDVQTVTLAAGAAPAPAPRRRPPTASSVDDNTTEPPAQPQAPPSEPDDQASAPAEEGPPAAPSPVDEPPPGSVAAVAFDQVDFEGAGVVEVRLMIDDALAADNRAWTVVQPPRAVRVLLVTPGNIFLENVLGTLAVELTIMSPGEYDAAQEEELVHEDRSRFDVVILDGHSTSRLPTGNYFFWGAVPGIDGVQAGRVIDDQIIFNWDETHPVLRHVAVDTIDVFEWFELTLPPDAVSIIDGQTSPVMAYLTRDASQYLICAFRLVTEDESGNPMMNTYWVTRVHFVVFIQNSVQYLASAISAAGVKSVLTGEPATLPIPEKTTNVRIARPDGEVDVVPAGDYPSINYARTRQVGLYRVEPAIPGQESFVVNLFDPVEGRVAPVESLTLGDQTLETQATRQTVNRPAWPWFLLGILAFLVLEWIVYNKRVLL